MRTELNIKKKTLLHLNPSYKDNWCYKDGVQILFVIKKLKSFNVKLVTLNNDKNLECTKQYVEIDIINKSNLSGRFNNLNIIKYIFKSAKKTDVIFQYLISWNTLLYSFIFKKINKNITSYIKLDNSINAINDYEWFKLFYRAKEGQSLKYIIKKFLIQHYFIHSVNLFSVEDDDTKQFLLKKFNFFKDKLICIPNGLDFDQTRSINVKTFAEKENIILTAGRIGDYEKNTDIFLDAVLSIGFDNLQNWRIILAGGINNGFQFKIDDFYKKDKRFKENVFFVGHKNRDELFELYNKSKIFCLPSKWEGFANVFAEAMYFRNALITTNTTSPKNIIKNKMGLIIPPDDQTELAKAILILINNKEMLEMFCNEAHNYAKENLDWNKIVIKLINELNGSNKGYRF